MGFSVSGRRRRVLYAAALAATAGVGSLRALAHYQPDALFVDAKHFYLPFAREFLKSGFLFFADPRSVEVGPFSYIYPALFGAHVHVVKLFNIVLFGLLALVAARTATVLRSPLAGLCAAGLFALSRNLPSFFADLYSEAPFIALSMIWIWGIAEAIVGQRRAFIPLAGVAFGLCVLTRPTYLYFGYATALLAGILALRSRRESRTVYRDLFLVHAVGIAFPVAIIVKNLALFGFPGVNTGLGITLYLGNHPLTGGMNPKALGLAYDNSFATHGVHRLTLEGERVLKGIALAMLRDRPLPDLLSHFADKATTFVFVAHDALRDRWFNLRSWRIAELAPAVAGLWAIRNRPFRWLCAGAVIYQVAVHTPLFYLPRYSAVLDVWLALLAGVGIAFGVERWRQGGARQRAVTGALAALAIVGVALGEWNRASALDRMPDVRAVPHREIVSYEGEALMHGLRVPSSVAGIGAGPEYVIPARGVETENPRLGGRALVVASIHMEVGEGNRCRSAHLFYRAESDSRFRKDRGRAFRIKADGRFRWYHVGAFPLDVRRNGDFLLRLDCPVDTTLDVSAFKLSEDLVARTYRKRYLERVAAVR